MQDSFWLASAAFRLGLCEGIFWGSLDYRRKILMFCSAWWKMWDFWSISTRDILSWLDKMLSQMNITFFFDTNLIPYTVWERGVSQIQQWDRISSSHTHWKCLKAVKPKNSMSTEIIVQILFNLNVPSVNGEIYSSILLWCKPILSCFSTICI